uniref:Reelin n=1 Tax=Periophthalmus magnuspinnatus TaxID=409849 RepID=A0A3B3ZQN9_9GOBI
LQQATATHRGQIIFKDALAQQLCEQGVELHGKHAVLRDDFDSNLSHTQLDPSIWSECTNCDVGEQCGVLMHGRAVTFCEPFGERELVTAMFNHIETTVYADPSITVSYSLSAIGNSSDDEWITLEKIRAPTNSSTVVHLLPLPPQSRADGVRLRWSQDASQGPEGYESCWGLDNVLLVNSAHKTPLMEDNLDPPDTANWLFFPGSTIKVQIHSMDSRCRVTTCPSFGCLA